MTCLAAGWKKGVVALLSSALFFTMLVVAACGGAPAGQLSPDRPSDTVNWAEPPASTPNWIWPFYVSGNNTVINAELITMLYRPLYMFGHGNNADIDESLSLAQPPSWSADGKTATIALKGGYQWSNGEPVTAQGVLFNLNMYRAEESHETNYVPGYMPDNIVSASAPNSHTLVITTDKPYDHHWFLYNQLSQLTPWPDSWDLTGPGAPSDCATRESDCPAVYGYLAAQAQNQSTYATSPLWSVVDGPWRLKSYNSNGNVSLVPNRDYGGPVKPRLKQFNMVPFTTDAAEFNVLRAGRVLDVGYIPTQYLDSPHPAHMSPLRAGPNPLSKQYTMAPWFLFRLNYFPLNFNGPQAPILKQLYFRQALQSVVDQIDVLQSAAKGYGVPTDGPVPTVPMSPLVTSDERNNPYPFNISRASQLLSSNGWTVKPGGTTTCTKPGSGPGECGAGIPAGTPLSFQLFYASGLQTVTMGMESLRSNASRAGIQITLRGESFAQVVTNYSIPCSPGTPACNWSMANWGAGWVYGPDYYPTGETLFQTGALSNAGSYSDPQVDQYVQQSMLSNGTAAFENYEGALAKNVPVIWQPNYTYALNEVGKGLRGVTPNSPLAFIFPEDWHY